MVAGASWEIKKANQVLVGILHTEVTTLAWSFGLRNLIIPGREDLRRFSPFCPIAGQPFDHARNSTVDMMFAVGADWLFCYDSDVVPPRDAIPRLMAWNQPIVSGMYCRRSPPHMIPVMIRNGVWGPAPPNSGLIEVDVVGAGCLLIHRTVFEKLPPQRPQAGKKWFDWRVDMKGLPDVPDGYCLSEDFTLCMHAKGHGYKVLCDTSVVCRHIGLAEAGYQSFVPLNTTPYT